MEDDSNISYSSGDEFADEDMVPEKAKEKKVDIFSEEREEKEGSFRVLSKQDITHLVETDILTISTALSVPRKAAIGLLVQNGWDPHLGGEAFLSQKEKEVGLDGCDDDYGGDDDYLVKSYVYSKENIIWCPAPGCEHAIEYDAGVGRKGGAARFEVHCRCSHVFCWNCSDEAHSPVECGTAQQWILKIVSGSENPNYMLANTKPCASCKRPIEKIGAETKNIQMTCAKPCSFEFCWLCLGGWSAKHNSLNRDLCTHYEKAKKEGRYEEYERERKRAKVCLEEYTRHYSKWVEHHVSRDRALKDKRKLEDGKILERLGDIQRQPADFIVRAWDQILECRRALKWAYVYGYYLPAEETKKRDFLDFAINDAETALERLIQCAEVDLFYYVQADVPLNDFDDFRRKLSQLTYVTRKFFHKLVEEFENNLPDVEAKRD